MYTLDNLIASYLENCKIQKQLDAKTLKAYRIDLHQFSNSCPVDYPDALTPNYLEQYIGSLHHSYKPHMFRHSFATLLLEKDVDIRYIQEMLGHSSTNLTQIYTHLSMAKQKDILTSKHPRKDLHFSSK